MFIGQADSYNWVSDSGESDYSEEDTAAEWGAGGVRVDGEIGITSLEIHK